MVIGNGMIATRFGSYKEDERFVVFASGVSNSTLTDVESFEREINLLKEIIRKYPTVQLVYFSTCSIYDAAMQQTAYVLHKLTIEKLIRDTQPNHIIFRVSNPVGKTDNRNTILNYFITHIRERKHFTAWKYATRNLIDLDDMYAICDCILQKQTYNSATINIANPVNYSVISIIHAIEQHFSIKADYSIVDKGSSPLIDITSIEPVLSELKLEFDEHYFAQLLTKYFPANELPVS
jgi:nucleoside-diphosphate-sugar epimerase